jgi:hypothetical protein
MNGNPTNWKRALVASTLTLAFAAASTAWASTQDVAPAKPAAPAKASAPAPKKKAAAKKPQTAAKTAQAAQPNAAGACEPARTFVPVQDQGVCTPATPPADGQKFNTLEDIYIPPPEPEKK